LLNEKLYLRVTADGRFYSKVDTYERIYTYLNFVLSMYRLSLFVYHELYIQYLQNDIGGSKMCSETHSIAT